MPTISTADIQTLRRQTGVGILEAKKALTTANGDMTLAVDTLRKAGRKLAAAKSTRTVREGLVGTYLHANGKVAAMVVLACETDFVARTDDFADLAHDLALHIAAVDPRYLRREDVPVAVLDRERDIYRAQLKTAGQPKKMWPAIINGQLEKFYADVCLLDQAYVKDDRRTVGQLIESTVAKLGENIQVSSFARLTV
ncbi:MAG: translation elongation factor Ts [Patescibacteria group bacterium]